MVKHAGYVDWIGKSTCPIHLLASMVRGVQGRFSYHVWEGELVTARVADLAVFCLLVALEEVVFRLQSPWHGSACN